MFKGYRKYIRSILFGRRRIHNSALLSGLLLIITALALIRCLRIQESLISAQLDHYRTNRDLGSYIDDILDPLIEPSSTPCEDLRDLPVIALVTSAPRHRRQREAIRQTWAGDLPTYFFLGVGPDTEDLSVDDKFVDNYVESKQHQDIVVFDFIDTYTNLTLKIALMMRWALKRCPQAEFVLKTDDDVLVNPWLLKDVLRENQDAQLLGVKIEQGILHHRNVFNKWHIPRWLYPHDTVPEYLQGSGYAINGECLSKMYEASREVPLINLEDIFYTYLVAKQKLGLTLTHDKRFGRAPPWIPLNCIFGNYAIVHSLEPERILQYWNHVTELRGNETLPCRFYKRYFYDILYTYCFILTSCEVICQEPVTLEVT